MLFDLIPLCRGFFLKPYPITTDRQLPENIKSDGLNSPLWYSIIFHDSSLASKEIHDDPPLLRSRPAAPGLITQGLAD